MALSFKVKKKGKGFEKMVKQMHELTRQSVQVGHFKEQGEHYSGMTYPELMALHHAARANGMPYPDRPVLDVLFFREQALNSSEAKAIVAKHRKAGMTPAANEAFMRDLGEYLRGREKDIFGSGLLPPSGSPNGPLVDTGDLRDYSAYRLSKDNVIKEE